jgi:hypothetical protein
MISDQLRWLLMSFVIAAVIAALLYRFLASQSAISGLELGAICFLALLFLLVSNVDKITNVTMGTSGFSLELQQLKMATSANDQAISDLILLAMGPATFYNLSKLASGSFGPYVKEKHIGLETELYHLRNLGYITLKNSRSIHEIPEKGEQLSDYFDVTDIGRRYIELRTKHEARV